MKRIVLAVMAVMFLSSTVYADGILTLMQKKSTPEQLVAYVDQTNAARQRQMDAIKKDPKAYADAQAKALDLQIKMYQQQVDMLKARQAAITKDPNAYAAAQTTFIGKQIANDTASIQITKDALAKQPKPAIGKPVVKPAH